MRDRMAQQATERRQAREAVQPPLPLPLALPSQVFAMGTVAAVVTPAAPPSQLGLALFDGTFTGAAQRPSHACASSCLASSPAYTPPYCASARACASPRHKPDRDADGAPAAAGALGVGSAGPGAFGTLLQRPKSGRPAVAAYSTTAPQNLSFGNATPQPAIAAASAATAAAAAAAAAAIRPESLSSTTHASVPVATPSLQALAPLAPSHTTAGRLSALGSCAAPMCPNVLLSPQPAPAPRLVSRASPSRNTSAAECTQIAQPSFRPVSLSTPALAAAAGAATSVSAAAPAAAAAGVDRDGDNGYSGSTGGGYTRGVAGSYTGGFSVRRRPGPESVPTKLVSVGEPAPLAQMQQASPVQSGHGAFEAGSTTHVLGAAGRLAGNAVGGGSAGFGGGSAGVAGGRAAFAGAVVSPLRAQQGRDAAAAAQPSGPGRAPGLALVGAAIGAAPRSPAHAALATRPAAPCLGAAAPADAPELLPPSMSRPTSATAASAAFASNRFPDAAAAEPAAAAAAAGEGSSSRRMALAGPTRLSARISPAATTASLGLKGTSVAGAALSTTRPGSARTAGSAAAAPQRPPAAAHAPQLGSPQPATAGTASPNARDDSPAKLPRPFSGKPAAAMAADAARGQAAARPLRPPNGHAASFGGQTRLQLESGTTRPQLDSGGLASTPLVPQGPTGAPLVRHGVFGTGRSSANQLQRKLCEPPPPS
eukprot:363626-Chlamydomonas_euryale.AAC.2